MESRNARLFSLLDGKADVVAIVNSGDSHTDHNFKYFTNAKSGIFEGSIAFVGSKKTTVVTSQLEAASLKGLDLNVKVFGTRKQFEKIVGSIASKYKTMGLNFPAVTYEGLRQLKKSFKGKTVDVSEEIAKCRAVKDRDEIRKIEESCRIASRVADRIPGMLSEGMTESQLSAKLSMALYEEGSEGPSFSPIVSFGKTTAIPHYFPGKLKLKKGDLVLTDFGGKYEMYCSDITRTYIFGKANDRQRRLYETVKASQEAAFSRIKAGASEKDVDAAARSVIDGTEFKGRFIHGLGHGLGLQVHDGGPVLSPRGSGTLEVGMVVTVEPGAYVEGYGGVRIEDDVVVTKSGCRQLTNAKRELTEV